MFKKILIALSLLGVAAFNNGGLRERNSCRGR